MLKVYENLEMVLKLNQASAVIQGFTISLQNSCLPLYIFQHTLEERVRIFLETLMVVSSRRRH